jgi:hypothetical protein
LYPESRATLSALEEISARPAKIAQEFLWLYSKRATRFFLKPAISYLRFLRLLHTEGVARTGFHLCDYARAGVVGIVSAANSSKLALQIALEEVEIQSKRP